MFRSDDLSKIIEFIQKLVPSVQLLKIEQFTAIKELNVQLGNTKKIYNQINFNIEGISSQEEPVALDTLRKPVEEIEKSITFPQKNTFTPVNTPTDDIKSIPFSNGFHLIIDQKNWWNKEGDTDKSVLIKHRYIKLIPICKNSWSHVKTIENENRFRLQVDESGQIYAKIWADEQNAVRITELPPWVSELFEFQSYKPGEMIKFENFPEIVISLDKTVVEKAIMVKYDPQESRSEYFVFILARD